MGRPQELTAALVLFVVVSVAGGRAATDTRKPLTPEVAITRRTESDLHFSPDGSRVAFVVNEPIKGTSWSEHIWVLNVASEKVRQYTLSARSEYSPRWSLDGQSLAFLSDRSDSVQIYSLPSAGGEAVALTEPKYSLVA